MIFRWLSPALCLALAATLALWFNNPWALAVLLLPLAVALPGLLRGKRYTAAWVSLLTLPYIALGMTEAMATPEVRAYAYAVMGTAGALFVSVVLYVRGTRQPPAVDSAQP